MQARVKRKTLSKKAENIIRQLIETGWNCYTIWVSAFLHFFEKEGVHIVVNRLGNTRKPSKIEMDQNGLYKSI